ncbi:MAG: hypothetical protein DCC71_07785 [Proteobacteria bacterium]|nr:MAG: hypothetical protein DCC71_07785 [Pseudomonadota bacterium]
MRTGAMRIGLGAEAGRGFELGVRVVPIGINFSQPGAHRSDLLLRVGTPIVLARHAAAYRADPVATVNALTDALRERIESLVIHLDDLTQAPIVSAAYEVFGADWIADPRILPEIADEATRRIEVKRAIAQAVEYYGRFQPAWALGLQRRITAYRAALECMRLTEEMLQREVSALPLLRQTLPAAVAGVLGAPLAGFGWLINRLPRHVTSWAARRFAANPTQLAAYELWIGIQAFAASYTVVFLLLRRWADLGRAEAIAALMLLPVVGWLSSRWFALIRLWTENLRLTAYHALRRGRIEQLRFAREQLRRDQHKLRALVIGEPEPEPAQQTAVVAPGAATITSAARADAYRTTRYEVADGAVAFTIRIDERSAALDALLEAKGLDAWAYVTAHNPHGELRDADSNAAANAALERELAASGRPYFRGRGAGTSDAWPPEASFLVLGIARDEAVALARRWGQVAIVAGRRGEKAELVWC